MSRRPPRVAQWLAARTAPSAEREFVIGDLAEQFDVRIDRTGARRARGWYRRQVAALVWHRPWRRRGVQAPADHPPTRRGDHMLLNLLQDTRYALRLLARQPMYAAVAVLSLSLAIGANGLVYGMVDSFVLNPFRFPDPDRLVSIGSTFPRLNQPEGFIEQHSTHEIIDFREADTLVNLAAFDIGNRAIANGSTAERKLTALLLDDPLPALGRPPVLGRGFTRDELAPGGPAVVIISHAVWQTMFGADPEMIGRVVPVNSVPRTVVGVTDADTSLLGTDIWIPWGGDPSAMPRDRRQFTLVARLAPGATLETANAELAALAARTVTTWGDEFPEYAGWRLRATPWNEAVTGQTRGLAGLLLGAGVLVLVIACTNLAGLMLARLNGRRRELGLRFALGAGGWQVGRLLLIEAAMVAAAAGALGLGLAYVALAGVPGLLPDRVVSTLAPPEVNLRVVGYCLLVALAAAVATAVMPAWQARRADPQDALREGHATGSRQRLRSALVVAQVTMAVVLLVAAGQMLASFARVQTRDPGFQMDQVATMRLTLAWERFGEPGAATRFFNEAVERITALPGVVVAAAAAQFPPAEVFRTAFEVDGAPPAGETIPTALVNTITPGYFDVLDIPLRAGRRLDARDHEDAPTAVVVNEAFARRYLDGRTTARLFVGPERVPAEVVGVVGDVRNASMLRAPEPEIFVTLDQGGGSNQYFLLARTTGDPLQGAVAMRETLASMDPDQPVYLVQSMEDAVAGSLFPQRVALVLVGVFAAGAMLIAVLGIYGIVAFFVTARAREIGIRVALGATARGVVRLVVGRAAWLLIGGAALGLIGGAFAARAAGAVLYESATVEPVAIAAVAVVLACVGLLASWLPARRALRLDPARVLRTE